MGAPTQQQAGVFEPSQQNDLSGIIGYHTDPIQEDHVFVLLERVAGTNINWIGEHPRQHEDISTSMQCRSQSALIGTWRDGLEKLLGQSIATVQFPRAGDQIRIQELNSRLAWLRCA